MTAYVALCTCMKAYVYTHVESLCSDYVALYTWEPTQLYIHIESLCCFMYTHVARDRRIQRKREREGNESV